MFCTLWVIFQALVVVVEGGVSSGIAETPAKVGLNNNGAAAGSKPNPRAQNGVQPNAEPLVARLVQVGGSFFIQPVGNQVGQFPLQQLIPIGAVQQAGTFFVGQSSGANVNLQGQLAQGATLFAVLPRENAGGDPQGAPLNQNQVYLFSLAGLKNEQQLGAAAGTVAGRLRLPRVAARLRRRSPEVNVMTTEEEDECSGIDTDEDLTE